MKFSVSKSFLSPILTGAHARTSGKKLSILIFNLYFLQFVVVNNSRRCIFSPTKSSFIFNDETCWARGSYAGRQEHGDRYQDGPHVSPTCSDFCPDLTHTLKGAGKWSTVLQWGFCAPIFKPSPPTLPPTREHFQWRECRAQERV